MHKIIKTFFLLVLVFVFDIHAQEQELQHFTLSDGLSNTSINDVAQDELGYLWLATDKGYSKFDGVNFINYNQDKANCIFIDKSKIYIGLKNGLLILQHQKKSFFKSKEILKIKFLNNKIFLATTEGVCEFKENTIQPIQINTQIDFSFINDITYDDNTFYIASVNGLWSFHNINNPKKLLKISDENYSTILKNNNQLLANTFNNGLKIIKGDSIVKSIYTQEKSLSLKRINEEIWITSKNNGIEILDANNYNFKRKINTYNTNISNRINTVFKDHQNAIWIASADKGLYKFTSNKAIDKPSVFIESIQVNYKDIFYLENKKLGLKSDENNISFAFNSVDLNNAKNIQYRYQLNKKSTGWSSQKKVDFANLKAGKYLFTVQSKNGELLSKKVSYSFFIETPIYQKTWFYIVCGVLLCLLLAGIIDLYIRKVNKKNKQKLDALKTENHLLTLEQKALQLQMNPHFIFNVLNGIKALGNAGKSKELNKTISQFSILLRSVLNNSRLEEISLQDEIETLKNYLDLEQKMSSISFDYSFETSLNNIDSEEILIPPMLLQPFIENCIIHAFIPNTKNAKIKVLFEVKNSFLHFTIEDNGVGFHQTKKEKTNHKSVALKVTKERIQNLSKYNVFSINEIKIDGKITGTRVTFKIPLKTDY